MLVGVGVGTCNGVRASSQITSRSKSWSREGSRVTVIWPMTSLLDTPLACSVLVAWSQVSWRYISLLRRSWSGCVQYLLWSINHRTAGGRSGWAKLWPCLWIHNMVIGPIITISWDEHICVAVAVGAASPSDHGHTRLQQYSLCSSDRFACWIVKSNTHYFWSSAVSLYCKPRGLSKGLLSAHSAAGGGGAGLLVPQADGVVWQMVQGRAPAEDPATLSGSNCSWCLWGGRSTGPRPAGWCPPPRPRPRSPAPRRGQAGADTASYTYLVPHHEVKCTNNWQCIKQKCSNCKEYI